MVTTIKTEKRTCLNCENNFMAFKGEVNRGGAKVCSRKCYSEYLIKTRPKGEKSWAWRGDRVKTDALHQWVIKNLGRPRLCSKCKKSDCKKYEWANISRKYKRDLTDWVRLCKSCHIRFDGSKGFKNFPRLSYKKFLKLKL